MSLTLDNYLDKYKSPSTKMVVLFSDEEMEHIASMVDKDEYEYYWVDIGTDEGAEIADRLGIRSAALVQVIRGGNVRSVDATKVSSFEDILEA